MYWRKMGGFKYSGPILLKLSQYNYIHNDTQTISPSFFVDGKSGDHIGAGWAHAVYHATWHSLQPNHQFGASAGIAGLNAPE